MANKLYYIECSYFPVAGPKNITRRSQNFQIKPNNEEVSAFLNILCIDFRYTITINVKETTQQTIKMLCFDQYKKDKHGALDLNIREDFVDPKSEPFSNLCKRAEKEGLNYFFEDGILLVYKDKIQYEENWEYRLFWHEYPIVNVNEIQIK